MISTLKKKNFWYTWFRKEEENSSKHPYMDPFKSAPIREKFRTIHYIFYVEYERLEFLVNYPTTLLNMEFVDKEVANLVLLIV